MYFMVGNLFVQDIRSVINVRDEVLIKAFGKHVRELRKKQGLTMEKLAALANIDYRQLSYIELGEVNITLSSIYALAKAFDISISELLKIDGY